MSATPATNTPTAAAVTPAPAKITLAGKVAVVTGASRYVVKSMLYMRIMIDIIHTSSHILMIYIDDSFNSGIGQGIALALARDGAKIVVNYNSDAKSAAAVVDTIKALPGGAAIAVQADVTKSADVDRLFAEAKKVFGRVDIAIANSGIATLTQSQSIHYYFISLTLYVTIGIAGADTHIANTTNEQFDKVTPSNTYRSGVSCMFIV
jgi:hypothetical protein